MFKVFFLLKRRSGISREAFRDHLENVHLKLVERHFGHMIQRCQRSYPAPDEPSSPDCVLEWTFQDRIAFDRLMDLRQTSREGQELLDDERLFLDGNGTSVLRCSDTEMVDSGHWGYRHQIPVCI